MLRKQSEKYHKIPVVIGLVTAILKIFFSELKTPRDGGEKSPKESLPPRYNF